jgi:hypothetical protein
MELVSENRTETTHFAILGSCPALNQIMVVTHRLA